MLKANPSHWFPPSKAGSMHVSVKSRRTDAELHRHNFKSYSDGWLIACSIGSQVRSSNNPGDIISGYYSPAEVYQEERAILL